MELGAGGGSRQTGSAKERVDRRERRKVERMTRMVLWKLLWRFVTGCRAVVSHFLLENGETRGIGRIVGIVSKHTFSWRSDMRLSHFGLVMYPHWRAVETVSTSTMSSTTEYLVM